MTPEDVEEKWVGKKVRIKSKSHPHSPREGEVVSLDETAVGYALKIDFEEGDAAYVFNGEQIEEL